MRFCTCKDPSNVYNDVCGRCLRPLSNSGYSEKDMALTLTKNELTGEALRILKKITRKALREIKSRGLVLPETQKLLRKYSR